MSPIWVCLGTITSFTICFLCCREMERKCRKKYNQGDASYAHNELNNSYICLGYIYAEFQSRGRGVKKAVALLTPQESGAVTCRELQTA